MSAVTEQQDCITVREAKRRYFGGTMSLRWWYRQIETGKLPHQRPGGSVRLRVVDVEAFVAATFRDKQQPEGEQPKPAAAPTARRSRPTGGGLRFFPENN